MNEMDPAISRRLFNVKDLPTIPPIYGRILKLMEDINYSVDQVSELIEMDQVLSTKALKLVNSPFYGLYSEVASIRRAIILLGANLIRGIILSTALFDIAEKKLPGLWDHSYCCSTVAVFLAKRLHLMTVEEIMTGALLHDIGKVLIRKQLPEEALEIDKLIKAKEIPMREAEEKIIGTSHDRVGKWLATEWYFPRIIEDTIAFHHTPHLCREHQKESAVIHLSDCIVKGLGISYSEDQFISPFQDEAWEALSLTESDLVDIMAEVIDILYADQTMAMYMQGMKR